MTTPNPGGDATRAEWAYLEPPWTTEPATDGTLGLCGRCGETLRPYWRHYWPRCRRCAVMSVAAQTILWMIGLDGHPWLYWGAVPDCPDCDGIGFLVCEPQDLSILRRSGACATCGAWSFVLCRATADEHDDIDGTAQHCDDEAVHEVVVVAAPLVRSVDETLSRSGHAS